MYASLTAASQIDNHGALTLNIATVATILNAKLEIALNNNAKGADRCRM